MFDFHKDFFVIWCFISLCVIIPIVIVVLSRILNSPLKNIQKNTTYECGFNQISDSRNIFDVQFFVTGILFLLFDVEIIFLFPWALNFSIIGVWGVFVGLVFVYILIFGFIYEWKRGALTWVNFLK